VWKTPQRTELVVAGGGKTRAYDPATGTPLWELAGSGRTSMTPVGDEDLLYVDTQERLAGTRGVLVAIRPGASGDISLKENEKTNSSIAWSVIGGGNRVASPLLYGGSVYIFEQQAALVRCLDAKTGAEHYRQRIPKGTGVTASPIAASGHIYVLGNDGLALVLKPGPKFEVVTENKLDGMFWSSPAVAGSTLLLRDSEQLFAIRQP
jgi:outer membrane protein assembly factor BamB